MSKMSGGFGAFRKMSKKCPNPISPERSPLKNVKKMSHPYGVLKKMSNKCPSPLWAPWFLEKRNERSHLGSLCRQEPPELWNRKNESHATWQARASCAMGEARTNESGRLSGRLPISFIYISRIRCVDLITKEVIYNGNIQFGKD